MLAPPQKTKMWQPPKKCLFFPFILIILIFFVGGGLTNERPGTDHVISGPMKGFEKNCIRWRKQTHKQTDRHTDGHRDSMTELAQWCRFSENSFYSTGKIVIFMILNICNYGFEPNEQKD